MIVIQLYMYILGLDCSNATRSCDLLFVELCRLCEDWKAEEVGGGGEIIFGLNCCCTTGEICKQRKMKK
jgi:hypothetical protein